MRVYDKHEGWINRAIPEQRNDEELKAAIAKEFEKDHEILTNAINALNHMYREFDKLSGIACADLDNTHASYSVRMHINGILNHLGHRAKTLGSASETCYLGNAAAMMEPDEAERLKAKYRDS